MVSASVCRLVIYEPTFNMSTGEEDISVKRVCEQSDLEVVFKPGARLVS